MYILHIFQLTLKFLSIVRSCIPEVNIIKTGLIDNFNEQIKMFTKMKVNNNSCFTSSNHAVNSNLLFLQGDKRFSSLLLLITTRR